MPSPCFMMALAKDLQKELFLDLAVTEVLGLSFPDVFSFFLINQKKVIILSLRKKITVKVLK